MMQKIDFDTWKRKPLFQFFEGESDPFYSVTFVQDVTKLHAYTKKKGLSFYYAMLYLAAKALNSIEAFRYGMVDGELVLFEKRRGSFTDVRPGDEYFHIVVAPMDGTLEEYCQAAKKANEAQEEFIVFEEEGDDLVYFTCAPWFEMTAMTNERDFQKYDAIPRVAWGKYVERDGRLQLNISVEVNHMFIDGFHIGLFHQRLAELMEELK